MSPEEKAKLQEVRKDCLRLVTNTIYRGNEDATSEDIVKAATIYTEFILGE